MTLNLPRSKAKAQHCDVIALSLVPSVLVENPHQILFLPFHGFPVNVPKQFLETTFAERKLVMNRSVTLVLCSVMVRAAELGEKTEAGLQPEKNSKNG